MLDVSPEIITIIMLGGFFAGVMTGFPLAMVIGGVGVIMGFLLYGSSSFDLIYSRVYAQLTNYTLLAVPLFVLMGALMERSGMTEKLYEALYLWLGGVKGGLALVTMIIGIIIGGPVGIVAASVSMLAAVGLPAMVNRGYDRALAAGTVAAGGCLGILIPPSIMFIVYGPMAAISVGKLFFAAVMPGFLLSALYMIFIAVKCWLQPELGPSIPESERIKLPFGKKMALLLSSLVAPTILIAAILGVIFFGVAAPTEAAGMGALATLLLVIASKRFNFKVLKDCALETFRTSGFIFLIVGFGFAFTGIFVASGAGDVFARVILSTPGGKWGIFAGIMFLCFALGFFIDWIAIVYILVPVVTEIADTLGFDPLWFAMMIIINFQMEFMTPPMAMAIFVVHGVAPKELNITMSDCIRGIWPFVFLVLVGLALCVAFPETILWLPGKMIK